MPALSIPRQNAFAADRAGFAGTLLAAAFSIFLMGWNGFYQGTEGWVNGFLAAFWSLIAMLRLLSLTETSAPAQTVSSISGRIVTSMHAQKNRCRDAVLGASLDAPFILFLFSGFMFGGFILSSGISSDGKEHILYLLLSAGLSSFVFRSYPALKGWRSAAMIALAAYVIAGGIFFLNPAFEKTDGLSFPGELLAEFGPGGFVLCLVLGLAPIARIVWKFRFSEPDMTLLAGCMIGFCGYVLAFFLPLGEYREAYLSLCFCLIFLSNDESLDKRTK